MNTLYIHYSAGHTYLMSRLFPVLVRTSYGKLNYGPVFAVHKIRHIAEQHARYRFAVNMRDYVARLHARLACRIAFIYLEHLRARLIGLRNKDTDAAIFAVKLRKVLLVLLICEIRCVRVVQGTHHAFCCRAQKLISARHFSVEFALYLVRKLAQRSCLAQVCIFVGGKYYLRTLILALYYKCCAHR